MSVAIVSISGSNTSASPVKGPAAAAQTGSETVAQAGSLKPDSVKLSIAGNVKLMHHQGLSNSIIAAQLGLSAKQVEDYYPTTTTASQTTAAPTAVSPESAESKTTVPVKTDATVPATPAATTASATLPQTAVKTPAA